MTKPTVTVGLLTADRPALTRRTLESFARFNDPSRFELLHHDDASADCENQNFAEVYRFASVCSTERVGQIESLRRLLALATCEWYLHLENDWEWVATFPWEMMGFSGECLRLYGAKKAREGERAPTGPYVMGTRELIVWQREADWEHGVAHWAGPPSVCRTDDLRRVAKDAASLKDISLRFRPWTWRPIENIVWHIGEQQTPGFKP